MAKMTSEEARAFVEKKAKEEQERIESKKLSCRPRTREEILRSLSRRGRKS